MISTKDFDTDELLKQTVGLLQNNQLQQAESACRKVLQSDPNNAAAHHYLGIIACQVGNVTLGAQLIHKAIQLRPDYAEAYKNYGKALAGMGRFDEAVKIFNQALKLRPDYAEALNDLGTILVKHLGQQNEAAACFRKALALNPKLYITHNNLGNILLVGGHFNEAISHFKKAVALRPDFFVVYSNLANAYKDQGDYSRALEGYQKALAINPNFYEALNNMGLTYYLMGNFDRAIATYQKALTVKKDYAEAWLNMGVSIFAQGETDKATSAFQTALKCKPDFHLAHSALLFFMNYRTGISQKEIFAESCRWDANHAAKLLDSSRSHENILDKERKLRLGYVSPDFRDHSVAYFIAPVLHSHNREIVEVFCYSDTLNHDAITEQLKSASDYWRQVTGWSDRDIAAQIQKDGIDILVDLSGHTLKNRLLVFARKPAPVQASWLGYPNTTGMRTIDYRLTDKVADPPGESDELHSETLIRLKNGFLCYQFPATVPAIAAPPSAASGQVTFGSFNNLSKVTPEVIQCWSAVLHKVKGSRLLLKAKQLKDETARKRIMQLFGDQGVAPERLELISWLPRKDEHLATYNKVDIGLDPFPYNGTTTTCEALLMGVPVVTFTGVRHSGRVGASIMHHAGLDELVAGSIEQYTQLAVSLAINPVKLATMRTSLRNQLQQSSLTAKKQFTESLEEAYRHMWSAWCDSKAERS